MSPDLDTVRNCKHTDTSVRYSVGIVQEARQNRASPAIVEKTFCARCGFMLQLQGQAMWDLPVEAYVE